MTKQKTLPLIPTIFIFCLLAVAAPSLDARAEDYNEAVYLERNDTYYELVRAETAFPDFNFPNLRYAISWESARELARTRYHNGRRGRLAVIDAEDIHTLLKEHYELDELAWIGLRYWCKYSKGTWEDGTKYSHTAFKVWAPLWNQDGTKASKTGKGRRPNCTSYLNYWPVHYWPKAKKDEYSPGAFKWNANGTYKHAKAFFIEYPPN
ncbi:MAG: C-type lectin domain-containing protein [Magnetospiraceae bacterium]